MKGRAALLTAAILAASGVADAHVGPSDTTNNRYYKLTPMSDRVRLAYTIFFGRDPALVMRRRIDVNRDGVLSSSEISDYGKVIADELHASVSFLQGGREAKILWQEVDLGFSSVEVGGGPFSVDFIGTVCLDDRKLGVLHELVFRDRMRLPKPGETELSMAPAPGISITETLLDGRAARHDEKWQGGPGPAQSGYHFAFKVESDELAPLDSACEVPKQSSSRAWLLWIGAAGLLLVGLGLYRRLRSTR